MVFLVGLVVFLVSLLVASWGLVSTLVALIRRRPAGRAARVLRGLALLTGALAVGGYAFGVVVIGAQQSESSHGTDSSPSPACRLSAPTPSSISHVTGYDAGYLPLRFDCKLDDGTTYSAGVVSPWLTPAMLALGATALGLAFGARSTTTRRTPEAAPVAA
ncbi:hypothetical protein F1D05_01670 [Kribbella qitaiheensis]|uniref:Uncharacterized protein n=1 Tax=Kribbella qitaiheensis TaxID=1544730 RepID=A0A7G6WS78_9ACTN|nr:hypothetical protein [Kribbella qitaiheensis]QNE16843.1 hypothetical protein F1D05_01670 [Kribbella qitaiheensis]